MKVGQRNTFYIGHVTLFSLSDAGEFGGNKGGTAAGGLQVPVVVSWVQVQR